MTDFDEDMQDRVYKQLYTGPCLVIGILILIIAALVIGLITEMF